MKIACAFVVFISLAVHCFAESISEKDASYIEVCEKAVSDPWHFQNFRSLASYTHIVELSGTGDKCVQYILNNGSRRIIDALPIFEKLDVIGNPPTHPFSNLGTFSETTLRYILIANHIQQLFSLPENAIIAEIGAGFGGQCFVLSHVPSFGNYYIYDLPIVETLIGKVLNQLQVSNVKCLPLTEEIPQDKIDLVISNYAFSECNRETQLDYFEKVIRKAERGYITYNQISSLFSVDSLTPGEFMKLLQQSGKRPFAYKEPVSTASNNIIILWKK